MLEIKTFEVGSFGTNMYLVSFDQPVAQSVSPQDGLSAKRSVLCQRSDLFLIDPACSSLYEQQMLDRSVNEVVCQSEGRSVFCQCNGLSVNEVNDLNINLYEKL